jgi:hypothetical protein
MKSLKLQTPLWLSNQRSPSRRWSLGLLSIAFACALWAIIRKAKGGA